MSQEKMWWPDEVEACIRDALGDVIVSKPLTSFQPTKLHPVQRIVIDCMTREAQQAVLSLFSDPEKWGEEFATPKNTVSGRDSYEHAVAFTFSPDAHVRRGQMELFQEILPEIKRNMVERPSVAAGQAEIEQASNVSVPYRWLIRGRVSDSFSNEHPVGFKWNGAGVEWLIKGTFGQENVKVLPENNTSKLVRAVLRQPEPNIRFSVTFSEGADTLLNMIKKKQATHPFWEVPKIKKIDDSTVELAFRCHDWNLLRDQATGICRMYECIRQITSYEPYLEQLPHNEPSPKKFICTPWVASVLERYLLSGEEHFPNKEVPTISYDCAGTRAGVLQVYYDNYLSGPSQMEAFDEIIKAVIAEINIATAPVPSETPERTHVDRLGRSDSAAERGR